MTFQARPILVALLLSSVACGGDDGGGGSSPDASEVVPDAQAACGAAVDYLPAGWRPIATVSAGAVNNAVGSFTVDATAGGAADAATQPFLYLDLSGTNPIKVNLNDDQALDDAGWDLALKRFVVRSNGGDSGTGSVRVARVAAASLDEVSGVLADPDFVQDDWVSDSCTYLADSVGGPLTSFSDWFSVDAGIFTPRDFVYVVETRTGAHVALEILDYYADPAAPTRSAVYQIAWKAL